MYYSITNSGFPHSEIPGSQSTYNSPRHIGVSPVLHQLLVPRHSPCALVHLTKLISELGFSPNSESLSSHLCSKKVLYFLSCQVMPTYYRHDCLILASAPYINVQSLLLFI